MNLDIAVQQICRIHNLVHVESMIGENDSAIGSTELKGLLDGRRVVHWLTEVGERLRVEVASRAIIDDVCRCQSYGGGNCEYM